MHAFRLLVLLMVATACDSTLDTGYAPRRLSNTSEADRRSFYAPAFTPQSQPEKSGSTPDVGQHGPGRY